MPNDELPENGTLWSRLLYVICSPWRLFKLICFLLGLQMIVASLAVGVYCYQFYRSLPRLDHMTYNDLKALARKRVQSKAEDKRQLRPWVDIDNVSRDYLYSIVMSEDSGFFEHHGFEVDAMLTSMAEDLKEHKLAYGASTISQQVSKNLFLSNDKAIVRKVKEVFITMELEKHFKKNQILELYFNMAEFGPDLFGVGAASEHYFGKKPSQVNAAEGAFIALMLPSPRKYHYAIFENQNLTRSRLRRIHRVLSDMYSEELISAKQYRQYLHYNYAKATRKALERDVAEKRNARD